MPAARQRSRSASASWEVRATMGMSRGHGGLALAASSPRITRLAVMPSISGISMSMRMQSKGRPGLSPNSARQASLPFFAVTVSCPASRRIWENTARLSLASSTSRMCRHIRSRSADGAGAGAASREASATAAARAVA
ncbi:hypothetical protein DSECCO2_636000 [anaerobic digester metagenome]